MRLSTILFAAAVCAAVVTPAFPQLRLLGNRSCTRSADGGSTITLNLSPTVMRDLMTGAPYFAVRSSQSVQTLADGTHLTRNARVETAMWRDSNGRVRTEIHVPPGERDPLCESRLAEIEDPIAGHVYLLDSVGWVAYRLPLKAMPAPAAGPPQSSPLDSGFATQSLGEKTMFGVTVTGARRTITYPVGSSIGNDRPVTTTEETWLSPQLGLVVYSQRTEYTGIVTTITTKDVSIAEPDPSLMQVPPGYRVIDESGSFAITIPAHS